MKLLKFGYVGVLAAAFFPAFGQDTNQDGLVEEIVVTGSRLLDMESSVSPVQVITAETLYDFPAESVTDYLQTMLPSNFNAFDLANQGINGEDARQSGNRGSSVDLRGLGRQNTLVLINGKRTAVYPAFDRATGWQAVDLNATLPTIAVGSIQVLSDGGSAIYGSDAIAGVVNVVPDYGYRGFDFQVRTQAHDRELGEPDTTLSFKYGGGNDTTNFLLAADYRTADFLNSFETGIQPYFPDPTGNADDFPRRPGISTYGAVNAMGEVAIVAGMGMGMGGGMAPGPSVIPFVRDPLCGNAAALGVDPVAAGFPHNATNPAGAPLTIQNPISPNAQAGPGSTSCDGFVDDLWRTGQIEREEINLFAAVSHDFSDTVRLTAEIGHSNREQTDIYTHNFANLGLANGIALTPDAIGGFPIIIPAGNPGAQYYATQPGATAEEIAVFGNPTGIVPFDVRYGNFLSPMEAFNDFDQTRIGADLNWQVSDNWSLNFGLSQASNEVVNGVPQMHLERYTNALNGLGGTGCDPATGTPGTGGCEYYNPFMSAGLPNAADLGLANSAALHEYIIIDNATAFEMDFLSFSIDLTGTTNVELGGGPIGVAVGIASRTEEFTVTNSEFAKSQTQILDLLTLPALDIDSETTTDSVYAEIALPITPNFDVQIAARYEDNDFGFDSTDPKVGFNLRPTEAVTIRGSWGTSFRAPTALQNDPLALIQERRTMRLFDPDLEEGVGPDLRANYDLSSVQRGNLNLEPETATNFTLGTDLRLSDLFNWSSDRSTLTLSLDYINIEFEDVIRLATNDERLRLDECHVHETSIDDPRGSIDTIWELIPVNPDGSGDGDCFRFLGGTFDPTTENIPVAVYGTAVNLGSIETEMIDIGLNYEVNTSVGTFAVRPQATYLIKMDVQQGPGESVVDAEGRFGINFIRPAPEWRANMPISWRSNGGRHSLILTPRYISSVISELGTAEISSALYYDLNYTWTFSNQLRASLFANNITDELAGLNDNVPGTFLPPYGRRWGLQMNYRFE